MTAEQTQPIEPSNPFGYTPFELAQQEKEAARTADRLIDAEPGLREAIDNGSPEATSRVINMAKEAHDSFVRVALLQRAENRADSDRLRKAA